MDFPDAVTMLLNGEHGAGFAQSEKKSSPLPKPFKLPEAHTDMRRVFAYLIKARCIDREVIRHFAKAGTLFEDSKYHNAVFVGKDENGVAKHAHKRSTFTLGVSYRGNVEGSDTKCSFHHIGQSGRLYVFESPIDMLSFLTMYPDRWQRHSHVALCGVSPQAMMHMLEQNPPIQEVALCLDNDAAGLEATKRLTEALKQTGYENVSCLLPEYKDWNEMLQQQSCQDEPEPEMSMSMQTQNTTIYKYLWLTRVKCLSPAFLRMTSRRFDFVSTYCFKSFSEMGRSQFPSSGSKYPPMLSMTYVSSILYRAPKSS